MFAVTSSSYSIPNLIWEAGIEVGSAFSSMPTYKKVAVVALVCMPAAEAGLMSCSACMAFCLATTGGGFAALCAAFCAVPCAAPLPRELQLS